ncbi:MAG: hypothetical protein ACLVEV_07595 [Lachnospiraceae bacterium]
MKSVIRLPELTAAAFTAQYIIPVYSAHKRKERRKVLSKCDQTIYGIPTSALDNIPKRTVVHRTIKFSLFCIISGLLSDG